MTNAAGSVVSADPALGRYVGRYELVHEIATGGMATVFLGRARGAANFERIVALKICHPHLRRDEDFANMFLDEARLAAQIHHPNVVSTVDVGNEEDLYLVMEYVEGDRLSGLIRSASKKGQRMPLAVTTRVMIDVLSGLHAAHELVDAKGEALHIVHRDVSPQNILVGVNGVAKITDFGIAKAEARATVTREGQVKGKMSYMAPEQLSCRDVDRRADLYAAGVVFWEALTGRRLFRADTDAETLNMVLHGVVPAPSSVAPEVPPELDAIVVKALQREPGKRFATGAEMADAIENAGFKVANARAVATYITEVLAEPLAQRRELLRKIAEGLIVPNPERNADLSHSAVRPAGSTLTSNPRADSLSGPGNALPTLRPGATNTELVAVPAPASRKGLLVAVAGFGLLLAVGLGVLAAQGGASPGVTRPVAPTPRRPAEPVVVVVQPQTPTQPAQPTGTPDPSAHMVIEAPVDPPTPERPGRHGRNRTRPGQNASSGSTPTNTHTNPTPGHGGGEFRPTGI
ncbi:MAG: serine/threonine protein kinase [Deltaproteobacteria bacterium]|nr:serine/threonine protein kinase [Deltaproteobacteria bacterium]